MTVATKLGFALALASLLMGLLCSFFAVMAFIGVQEHAIASHWSEIVASETGLQSQKHAYAIASKMAVESVHMHRWWQAIAGVLLIITSVVLRRMLSPRPLGVLRS